MRVRIMPLLAYNTRRWKLSTQWRIVSVGWGLPHQEPNGVACFMRVSILAGLFIATLFTLAPMAFSQELIDESVPNEWIQDYLPEKLPELKFPEYYNDLDKAREQVYRGRYKAALMTLQKLAGDKKGDAVQVALIKASALSAVGRRDEAACGLCDAAGG